MFNCETIEIGFLSIKIFFLTITASEMPIFTPKLVYKVKIINCDPELREGFQGLT